jgi:hypothetical protein
LEQSCAKNDTPIQVPEATQLTGSIFFHHSDQKSKSSDQKTMRTIQQIRIGEINVGFFIGEVFYCCEGITLSQVQHNNAPPKNTSDQVEVKLEPFVEQNADWNLTDEHGKSFALATRTSGNSSTVTFEPATSTSVEAEIQEHGPRLTIRTNEIFDCYSDQYYSNPYVATNLVFIDTAISLLFGFNST